MNEDDYPDHDFTDPANEDTFIRAYKDMTNYDLHPRCPCGEVRNPLPMTGVAWGWESIHDDRCPVNVEFQAPAVFRVVDNYGGPEHLEAEAIWGASLNDDQPDEFRS